MKRQRTNKYRDHYSIQAQNRGYRARSVYKLMEIQQKYHLLHSGHTVVDFGAAPGSWTQYCATIVGKKGQVCAVDRHRFSLPSSGSNVIIIEGDIYEEDTILSLQPYAPYHGVLSDAAPSTVGNKIIDAERSYQLIVRIMSLLPQLLVHGGYCVAKCFWSEQCRALYSQLKSQFSQLVTQRPAATRSNSKECYIVASGYSPE